MDIAPRPPPDPAFNRDQAFNRDPAFIDALVRLYPAFIRGPAFIRRRRLIEEIRYIYIENPRIEQTRKLASLAIIDGLSLLSQCSEHVTIPHNFRICVPKSKSSQS